MTRSFAWVGVSMLFGGALVVFSACGSEDLSDDDGQAIGGRAGSGVIPGGGRGGSGGAAPMTNLGSHCVTNEDCGGDGLKCVTDKKDGSRFPGGLCTIDCDPGAFDADCAALGENALCTVFAEDDQTGEPTESYCLQGCSLGAEEQCGTRKDVLCIDISLSSDPAPVCLPLCGSDDQCGALQCNGESGYCDATGDPGMKPLGAPCNPDGDPDECADGFCLALENDSPEGFCTSLCRGDAFPQCGWEGEGTAPTGICLVDSDAGPAELGLCGKTCDCDAECGQSAFICRADPGLEELGPKGYCVLRGDSGPTTGIPTCEGGEGGAGGEGGGAN